MTEAGSQLEADVTRLSSLGSREEIFAECERIYRQNSDRFGALSEEERADLEQALSQYMARLSQHVARIEGAG